MSTLTKVFVVLLVVSSIAFSTMVVAVVSQTTNWKDLSEKYQQNAQIAETNYRLVSASNLASLAMAQDKLNAQAQELADLQAELQKVKDEMAAQQVELAQAESERANYDAINRGLVAQLKVAQDTGNSFYEKYNELEERSLRTEQLNNDLNDRVNELTARVVVLMEQKRQAEQQINILQQANEQLAAAGNGATTMLESADSAAVMGVMPETAVAGATIRGKVLNVKNDYVTISVGSSDGVRKGMVFVIHRNSGGTLEYVGDVKVTMVEPDRAAGMLVESASTPSPDDQVIDATSLISSRG